MTQKHDYQYFNLIETVLDKGTEKTDRTGVGTISYPSLQMRFDISDYSIPLLTSKQMFERGMKEELCWYFRGETNIQALLDANVHIWDNWADKNGDLGPVYGAMWRAWPDTQVVHPSRLDEFEDRGYNALGAVQLIDQVQPHYVVHKKIDQLAEAIALIKNNPDSRRIIVNSWNPGLLPVDMKVPKNNPKRGLQALPPCHCMFQFYVADGKLTCDLRQRSADIGLGVPFNIAQYSMMTIILAKMCGLEPGEFIWNGVDCHIYNNHIDKLKEQITREPYDSPYLEVAVTVAGKDPSSVTPSEFYVRDYTHHPKIQLDVAT